MREYLGRQGGASGSMSNKGSGEKQIELDRRHILKRTSELRRELELIEHDRDVQRKRRGKSVTPLVSLVGYTNAGKSTVMNALLKNSIEKDGLNDASEAKLVEAKDMLFATLDTTVRRIEVSNHRDFLLSDTVGFVANLPHTLVKAFRSTLEEIKYADLLLEVVDVSDEHYKEQMHVTKETLEEIGAKDIPIIHVMNKCDKGQMDIVYPRIKDNYIYISAGTNVGITELIALVQDKLYADNRRVLMTFPYSMGAAVAELNDKSKIYKQEYMEDGIHIEADCPKHLYGKYADYVEAEIL